MSRPAAIAMAHAITMPAATRPQIAPESGTASKAAMSPGTNITDACTRKPAATEPCKMRFAGGLRVV
jgi:hypothetical protein